MLTNLLIPIVLARLISGLSTAGLALLGMRLAWQLLNQWQPDRSDERQRELEKRSELMATVIQIALFAALINVILTLLAGDRLSGAIRGAMCAYGVFDANTWGFMALFSSTLSALSCGWWLIFHRFDLQLERPVLTKRKFSALFFIAPLIVADVLLTGLWALNLDTRMTTSCCSLNLDDAIQSNAGFLAGQPTTVGFIGLICGLAAALSALWCARKPGPYIARITSLASLLGGIACIAAIVLYIAPHVYETPQHRCPFCLLHWEEGGLGWPLFAALFLAVLFGSSMTWIEGQRRASGNDEHVNRFERTIARNAAYLWLLTLSLAAWPVVRYAWFTNGASLFVGG